jgi:hypothetical protein
VTADLAQAPEEVGRDTKPSRRPLVLGLVGALCTLLGGVLLRTLAAHPFLPVDESANVAYAMEVAHGHIPVAGRHPVQVQFPAQREAAQHASNHPPLYHAIVGPILRYSLYVDHPTAGVLAARLVNLLFAAVAVLLAGVLAWTLTVKARSHVRMMMTVATAGLAGALPHLVTAAGIVENDSLAAMLVLGALVFLARIVTLGRTPGRLVGLTLCCATASLTRVTSVPTVLIISVILAIAGLCWPNRPDRRILDALWPPLVVLAATAAAAGWFLLLNIHRYGDWSGGKAVEGLIHAHEPSSSSPVRYLLDPYSWILQLREIVGGPDSRHGAYPNSTRPLGWVLLILLAIGLIALAIRLLVRQIRIPARVWLCLAGLTVIFCASMGEIAVHAHDGGLPHGRYLLPAAGAFLVAAAACLTSYPLKLGPIAVGGALCLEGFGTLRTFAVQLHRQWPLMSWWDAYTTGIRDMGLPAPGVVVVVLIGLMGVGILLQVGVLARLCWGRFPGLTR